MLYEMLADGGSIVLFAANGNLVLTREAKSSQTTALRRVRTHVRDA
jgi:hypothetical protein